MMKTKYWKRQTLILKSLLFFTVVCIGFTLLVSFSTVNTTQNFLNQLGLNELEARDLIESNVIYGNFDVYSLGRAKSIDLKARPAIALEILNYIKTYTQTDQFRQTYHKWRDEKKPTLLKMATPEEMKEELIKSSQASLIEIEAIYQKADQNLKAVYENLLNEAKKQVKFAQDPNNPMLANYKKNYPMAIKNMEESNQRLLAEWEKEYPVNQLDFVKYRMVQYLEETSGIDFNAKLITQGGKKVFADRKLESKSVRWKLAFRCGKEVYDVSRKFVETWMTELH